MNTSKQVNVIVGLLFVFLLSLLLYFVWDSVRAEDAEEQQLMDNAERGGKVFSLNCRACHGLTGRGVLENSNLPGAPLNLDANRPTEIGRLLEIQNRFRDTIRCGRVGTLMPPWSDSQGGPLNDFQIEQLVALITGTMPGFDIPGDPNAISEAGWEAVLDEANHTDVLKKQLASAAGAAADTLVLSDARGLTVSTPTSESLLRIDEEVVAVVDAPAGTKLSEAVSADADSLPVDDASRFQVGDTIQVDKERMRVTAVAEKRLEVERGLDDTSARKHSIKADVFEVGDEVQVRRGAFGTEAAAHDEGAEVYAGPIVPPTGPLTGEGASAPCGQRGVGPAAPAAEATPVTVSGPVALDMGDNFFDLAGQRNPGLAVTVGQSVTVNLTNGGRAIHNMRVAGEDNTYDSDDDDVSNPDIVPGGATATLTFTVDAPGTYNYRCDFHPLEMKATIVVSQ